MTKADLKSETRTEIEDSSSLKGTLASVAFVGFFIIVLWVGVYFLYLDRF